MQQHSWCVFNWQTKKSVDRPKNPKSDERNNIKISMVESFARERRIQRTEAISGLMWFPALALVSGRLDVRGYSWLTVLTVSQLWITPWLLTVDTEPPAVAPRPRSIDANASKHTGSSAPKPNVPQTVQFQPSVNCCPLCFCRSRLHSYKMFWAARRPQQSRTMSARLDESQTEVY